MARYIIKFFDKTTQMITEEDYKNLIGKMGLVFIKSIKQSINTSSISRIMPEAEYIDDLREKRSESHTGVLHDGTPVVRKFGMYYLASDPEVVIDTTHYPEVAKDCVCTHEEWEKNIKQLPPNKRLEAIIGIVDDEKRLGGDFKQIGDIKP